MKKFLSIIGAITMTATTSGSVVSCGFKVSGGGFGGHGHDDDGISINSVQHTWNYKDMLINIDQSNIALFKQAYEDGVKEWTDNDNSWMQEKNDYEKENGAMTSDDLGAWKVINYTNKAYLNWYKTILSYINYYQVFVFENKISKPTDLMHFSLEKLEEFKTILDGISIAKEATIDNVNLFIKNSNTDDLSLTDEDMQNWSDVKKSVTDYYSKPVDIYGSLISELINGSKKG